VRPLAVGFLLHVALLSVTDAVMSGPNSLALTVVLALALMRAHTPAHGGEAASATTPPHRSAPRAALPTRLDEATT